jgi:hypothetical protein
MDVVVFLIILIVLFLLAIWFYWGRRPAEAKPRRDDLTRIEGIGPKIAGVLGGAGIATFAQLAATNVSRLEQILRDHELTLANPATWPEQARLAAAGNWAALERLQDELKGGRRE